MFDDPLSAALVLTFRLEQIIFYVNTLPICFSMGSVPVASVQNYHCLCPSARRVEQLWPQNTWISVNTETLCFTAFVAGPSGLRSVQKIKHVCCLQLCAIGSLFSLLVRLGG